MNDSRDDDERSVDRSHESVGLMDLGDAKEETKQYNVIQSMVDSSMQLGWGG